MQNGTASTTGTQGLQEAGLGSGIMLTADGYILTNNHVVDGADQLIVKMGATGKIGKVVGTDPSSDLAVIKIDGTGYTPISVGSSKSLTVGQWVMAIGTPFGLDRTSTTGIVSALQRSDVQQDPNTGVVTYYVSLIQTDASINPGNSGGALVDEAGSLVGVTSLIESPSGALGYSQSAGIGFAIPSDYALLIANQLMKSGKAVHALMGISVQTVDQDAAIQGNQAVQSGVTVGSVSVGSPGDKAGIKAGDTITKIGDLPVLDDGDFFAGVRSHNVGDVVTVVVVRGTQTMTLNVTLGSDGSGS
jgi:putative serine protease PepD